MGQNEGKCIGGENAHLSGTYNIMGIFYITHSVMSALNDWILGILPVFLVRNAQMHTRKKIKVVFILGLGILAGVTAIIRVPL